MKKLIGKYILSWDWMLTNNDHCVLCATFVVLSVLLPVFLTFGFFKLPGLVGWFVAMTIHYFSITKFVELCKAKEEMDQTFKTFQNIVNNPLKRAETFFSECIKEAKEK